MVIIQDTCTHVITMDRREAVPIHFFQVYFVNTLDNKPFTGQIISYQYAVSSKKSVFLGSLYGGADVI